MEATGEREHVKNEKQGMLLERWDIGVINNFALCSFRNHSK